MRQWFRGELEGHYEGKPAAHAGPARDMRGRPHQIHIYRAHIRKLELLAEPPEPEDAPSATAHVLYQARIEHARLEDHRRRGLCMEGPVFELSVERPQLTHPAREGERLFGRVEGSATGYFELPEQTTLEELMPQPEEPALETADEAAAESELRESSVRIVPLEHPAHPHDSPTPSPSIEHALSTLHAPPEVLATPKAPPSNLPLLALIAALAITLLVTAGPSVALLWLAFLLPSLLIRRFLRGVLPDSTAFRAIGALLIAAQLCCVGWVLLGWSRAPCKELHVVPLLALVTGVFFASVLPYLMPAAVNALGFALVLGVWSAGPGHACRDVHEESAPKVNPPSVKHPGTPRTNDDGSWPKRP